VREIKFRIINTVNGGCDFVSLEYLLSNNQSNISPKNIIDDFKISQYTGLKDKNGVEIYEGDIVKSLGVSDYCFGVRPVEYINSSFTVKGYGLLERMVEVIGNIYENPELLESKND